MLSVHNDGVNGVSSRTRRRRVATGLAAAVLGLSACGGGSAEEPGAAGSEAASESASASPSAGESGASEAAEVPSAEPYLPVPAGVELTPEGSLLGVGDEATVAYRPRQGEIGVLGIKVTELRRTTFGESFEGWQLDDATRSATPYFVTARVTNEGPANVGGRTVPLYLLDDANTLVEPSTFAGDFEPCPSTPLPERFRNGDRQQVCLVFLAPEDRKLAGVSFRPEQDFDAITWAGDVVQPGDGQGGDGGQDGKGGGQAENKGKAGGDGGGNG